MQVSGINHPDDEGPDFLGVPAPESVPGLISPDSTCDKGERPEDETDDVELVVSSFKLFRLREHL